MAKLRTEETIHNKDGSTALIVKDMGEVVIELVTNTLRMYMKHDIDLLLRLGVKDIVISHLDFGTFRIVYDDKKGRHTKLYYHFEEAK